MSQGPTFTAGKSDANTARKLEKQRDAMLSGSNEEKAKISAETAAYRLQQQDQKFASTSFNDGALAQATVGLVSKEEFARRRAAIEGGGEASDAAAAANAAAAAVPPKEAKKKKKKANAGALSFAFDDEEGDGDGEAAFVPKKKRKEGGDEANTSSAEQSSSTTAAAAEALPTTAAAAAPATASTAPATAASTMPAEYTCIHRRADGSLDVQCEVVGGTSLPGTRVVSIGAQSVSLQVKASAAREGDLNQATADFLRGLLGGPPAVTVELVRGERAPIKTLRVSGVGSADLAYQRLRLASQHGRP